MSKPFWSEYFVSMSRTTMPDDAPVAMVIRARGRRVHQRVMISGSVLASSKPRLHNGTFCLSMIAVGNTGQPLAA